MEFAFQKVVLISSTQRFCSLTGTQYRTLLFEPQNSLSRVYLCVFFSHS